MEERERERDREIHREKSTPRGEERIERDKL